MPEPMSEEEIYRIARKRVEDQKGFYIHLSVYVIINAVIFLIWRFLAGGGFPWFLIPLGGWGIGLLFHFLGVFVFDRQTGWERRAIEQEAEKLRRQNKMP